MEPGRNSGGRVLLAWQFRVETHKIRVTKSNSRIKANDRILEGNVVRGSEVREIEAPPNLRSFFHGKPPSLWCRGDTALLNHTLLGIISARQIDSDLALKSTRLLKQLGSLRDVCFVGGWHSPLEEEALTVLLDQEASLVFCLSKAVDRFNPALEVEIRVNQGTALLLTHCSPKAKRITRDASMRRNELVVELAKAVLVLSAPEGSASLKLAKSALDCGKPVLTLEHPMNKELLASNALPATLENIQIALLEDRGTKEEAGGHDL